MKTVTQLLEHHISLERKIASIFTYQDIKVKQESSKNIEISLISSDLFINVKEYFYSLDG